MEFLKTMQKEKMNEEKQITKQELLEQKIVIENKIKNFEKKETTEKIIDSLKKIQDISESLADLQNSLNLVWKRTQQIEEELKSTLLS